MLSQKGNFYSILYLSYSSTFTFKYAFYLFHFYVFRKADTSLKLDDDHILSTLKWAKSRITKLTDLVSPDFAFLWVIPGSSQNLKELKHAGTTISNENI